MDEFIQSVRDTGAPAEITENIASSSESLKDAQKFLKGMLAKKRIQKQLSEEQLATLGDLASAKHTAKKLGTTPAGKTPRSKSQDTNSNVKKESPSKVLTATLTAQKTLTDDKNTVDSKSAAESKSTTNRMISADTKDSLKSRHDKLKLLEEAILKLKNNIRTTSSKTHLVQPI